MLVSNRVGYSTLLFGSAPPDHCSLGLERSTLSRATQVTITNAGCAHGCARLAAALDTARQRRARAARGAGPGRRDTTVREYGFIIKTLSGSVSNYRIVKGFQTRFSPIPESAWASNKRISNLTPRRRATFGSFMCADRYMGFPFRPPHFRRNQITDCQYCINATSYI